MSDWIYPLAWVIPTLPIIAAVAIALRLLLADLPPAYPVNDGADQAERLSVRLALAAATLALAGMLLLDLAAIGSTAPAGVAFGDWFVAGRLIVPLNFSLDGPALAIGTLWALLGTLSLAYASRYMHREPGFHRFFVGLCLFIGSMLLLVLAGNAGLAFVAWELAGISSWLLIGYAQERPAATGNALRAFVTNRIGDAAFIMSLGFAVLWTGSLEWSAIAAGAARMETVPAGLLASGFVIAALAKSAQVPFSPWLARALEGPTPSSAIFYGSLLVHAGVFLLLRLEPVLRHVPILLGLLVVIGAATALYAALCGLVQSDVKSSLMFATLTQVGLMVLCCGLGWFTLAAWHLALHAVWRAWQFFNAPSWLAITDAPARPVGAWLGRRTTLRAAAVQRFWLEDLGDTLLRDPTQRLGEDMDRIDERLLRPTLGLSDAPHTTRRAAATVALTALAERLGRFEQHLLVQGREGRGAQLLGHLGELLSRFEELIAQPRYLFLFIMATLVVIL